MFLPIDPSSGLPIYRQIVVQVRRMIASGTLAPGDRLVSVRELSAALGINPLTVAKAYGELENEGIVDMRRGLGMFVAQPLSKLPTASGRRETMRPAADRYALEAAQAGLGAGEAARLVVESFDHMGEGAGADTTTKRRQSR